jgi:dipeptidyl aminopeptidase/acylaminoacyl peptidase
MPLLFSTLLLLLGAIQARGQTFTRDEIAERVRDGGCVVLRGVNVCGAGFEFEGEAVEALQFTPAAGTGRLPGVLLIPGYQRTAHDYVSFGSQIAAEGYVTMAVTQRGFGRSTGKSDYVGPATLGALEAAVERLKRHPRVDPAKIAIYGHSRGGMAASLLAMRRDDLAAAILSAGVYDFMQAFCEAQMPGIRDNMALETGMTDEAIRIRSSVREVSALKTPLLILHGDQDKNVPVAQAYLLRDALKAAGKPFEIRIYPGLDHSLRGAAAFQDILEFLRLHLKTS